MLQVRLLGQFDVRLDGKRVTISSRAGQSLLAYLALTAGTPHRREKLAGLLWPDISEENARKNLRQELWRIRKALAGQNQATDFFLADDFTITFNRNADYWLDAVQMERPDLEIESLSVNLSLYQGELLPGFYEDWVALERERFQTIFETKMEQLLNQLITTERWIAVQEQAERWLSFGNSPEPAYRAIMLAHGARGDMAKVSSVYQRCMTDLDEKLGLEPSPETRALYDGLLKGTRTTSQSSIIRQAGTITFLFTDIEGSTSLLDKLGNQYAEVLADHHQIMRAAIQKWNGHEVDTQGDAFFVTFTHALDAIQCAAEAQRNLAAHKWDHGKPLRVRMGLHTGEPLIASTGYVGMDVHRAARIGDAAHGGQVLLSHTTHELVINELPGNLSIRDLGEYRLKDLKFPTPIYQLVIDGLKFDFPPLRTKFSGTEAPTPGEPPFKGLQFFDEKDSDLFFGREVLTAKLVRRLSESQFLSVIIGASGSGKSSVVRAGVIPALKKGTALIDGSNPPEDSTNWQIHILTPTAHPLEALATELTRDSESGTDSITLTDELMQDPRSLGLYLAQQKTRHHTLLVLDQFEELFTLCRDEFEREAFIDNLLTALQQDNSNITLIITLRADFYAHLAQYPELRDAVAHQQEYIGPMTTEELRRAIEEPAKRGHWAFEPGLIDLILRDVGDEPGALPLLSHALLETWKRRAGHTLTLKGYADAGGVRGAISHTAESVYQELSTEEQAIARNIFLRLTELGQGTEDTRRRASFDELISDQESAEETRTVLNQLADARLITLSEDSAEVAHEALIREWPTLREWLNQDREGLQLHRRLTEATYEWELLERDNGVLYRGAQLAQAREWAALHPSVLNANERAFLEASDNFEKQEIAEREAQHQREREAAQKLAETERQAGVRLRLRNRVITGVGVVAVILAVVAMSFSKQSSDNAQSALNAEATAIANANTAQSREVAIAALNNLNEDPERSILLALQSVSITHSMDGTILPESLEALHRSIISSRIQMTLEGHNTWVESADYSPDGMRLATIGEDGTVIVWDTLTGKELLRMAGTSEQDNQVFTQLVAYSKDRKVLVAGDGDLVKIYEAESGRLIKDLKEHQAYVTAIAISKDGKYIASGALDGSVIIWDVMNGYSPLQLIGHTDAVENLTFSPDGKWLVTAGDDPAIKIWNVQAGDLLQDYTDFEAGPWEVFFSPDGDRLSYSDADWGIHVWKIDSEATDDPTTFWTQELLTIPNAYGGIFSPEGSQLAGVSGNDIKVWDATTGRELITLAGHTQEVMGLAFNPDGKSLASTSIDGTVKVWSLLPGNERNPWQVIGTDFAYKPNGEDLITNTVGEGFGATVWDATTGEPRLTVTGHKAQVGYVVFNSDGTRFATGSVDGSIIIWDAGTGKKISAIAGHESGIQDIEFSPDGKLFATAGLDQTAKIWDAATGVLIREIVGHQDFVNGVSFSPDGAHLVTTSKDATAKIWDAKTGELLHTLTGQEGESVSVPAYNPDGSMIATAYEDGKVILWDAQTESQIQRLGGHGSRVWTIAFSPDGKLLAVGDLDNTVTLWDVESGKETLTLSGFSGTGKVGFRPENNGSNLVFTGADGAIHIFLLKTNELLALAQSRVTRSLTTEECRQYLHVDMCPAK